MGANCCVESREKQEKTYEVIENHKMSKVRITFTIPSPPPPPKRKDPSPVRVPTPEPVRVPTPEPVRIPTPEPVRIPTPEPVRIPTPEPVRIPTPEPVRLPTPEPIRIPTPEPEPVIEIVKPAISPKFEAPRQSAIIKLEIESDEEDQTITPTTFDISQMDRSPQEEVKEFKRVYKAVKGDVLDEIVQKIIFDLRCEMPIIRVKQGSYLIGTDLKMLMIKGNICMVRVGGGWERLDEYIIRVQEDQIDKIKRLMIETNKVYEYVMVQLLQDIKADKTVIANYKKYSKYNIPQKCLPPEYQTPKR